MPKPTLWTRGGLSLSRLTSNIYGAIRDDDLIGRASGLAFNFLLAFFPLMLFVLSLFSMFAWRSLQLETSFLLYFSKILPLSAFELLRQITNELSLETDGGKLTVSIALALWFASGGVSSMISTLNATYRVPDTRSWLRIRLTALGLTLVLAFLLLFAMFTVLIGTRLVDWLGAALNLETTSVLLWKAIQWPAALMFLMASFSLIYYFGPDLPHKRWHWITPGSLVGVLLWLAASWGFRLYLRYFNTYSASYGSLGAESLHPISPLTTTLSFGPISPTGDVVIKLIYDHRVLDGAYIARRLEPPPARGACHSAVCAQLFHLHAHPRAGKIE